MRVSIPRIRSVKFKKGGAELRVLRNNASQENVRNFVEDCGYIATARKEDMVGFAVVSWGREGDISSAIRISDGRLVGKTELPDFVKTAVNAHLFGRD